MKWALQKITASDMKYRYLVFNYECYYPSGGFGDLTLSTNSLDEAIECCSGRGWKNWEIIDLQEWKIADLRIGIQEPIRVAGWHNLED